MVGQAQLVPVGQAAHLGDSCAAVQPDLGGVGGGEGGVGGRTTAVMATQTRLVRASQEALATRLI